MIYNKLIAEFIGTFALVLIGGAAVIQSSDTGLLGIAFAHGFTVMVMIYAFGSISGAHINPAVTIGVYLSNAINLKEASLYILAQLMGAIFGAYMLTIFFGTSDLNMGATAPSESVNFFNAFLIELTLTFFLVNAVLHCAIDNKAGNLAGLAIGSTLFICILAGGPLTGASLNPARSFGPMLITGNFSYIALYFFGPISGSILASLVYKILKR